MEADDVKPRERDNKPDREPYSRPKLTRYGSISKLTQNGAGSGPDGGPMNAMAMMCL